MKNRTEYSSDKEAILAPAARTDAIIVSGKSDIVGTEVSTITFDSTCMIGDTQYNRYDGYVQ